MRSKTLAWAFLATLLMALIAAFTGCCKPEIRYVKVQVPIAIPAPEPPVLPWPDLPTQQLTPKSTDEAVVRAYVATIWVLRGRLAEAYAILNGYRTTSQPTPIPRVNK